MQYSPNSDEAVRALIRACPTLAGQYRQARLHLRDREEALRTHQIERSRHEHHRTLKEAERDSLINLCPADPDEHKVWAAKVALLELDLAQAQMGINYASDLVEDALREVSVCRAEIERINQEFGQDLGALPEAEFQQLMGLDFRQKRIRWIAARTLSASYGLPPDAMEALLEIPAQERVDYLVAHNQFLAAFNGQVGDAIAGQKKIGVGHDSNNIN